MTQTLAAVIHGESGSGKSYFGGTLPRIRLILDAEGGSRFIKTNRRRKKWNPLEGPPPVDDGTFDAVFVNVTSWQILYAAYQYLEAGVHPFESVIIDSLTEVQKRLVDSVSGVDQPTLNEWGTIGRNLEDIIRKFRDLIFHNKKPVNVAMLCLSHLRDGETRPYLKGAVELALPSFVDVVGYLYTEASTTVPGQIDHKMLLVSVNNIIAKDRTGELFAKYGAVCVDGDFQEWLEILEAQFGSDD